MTASLNSRETMTAVSGPPMGAMPLPTCSQIAVKRWIPCNVTQTCMSLHDTRQTFEYMDLPDMECTPRGGWWLQAAARRGGPRSRPALSAADSASGHAPHLCPDLSAHLPAECLNTGVFYGGTENTALLPRKAVTTSCADRVKIAAATTLLI